VRSRERILAFSGGAPDPPLEGTMKSVVEFVGEVMMGMSMTARDSEYTEDCQKNKGDLGSGSDAAREGEDGRECRK